MLRPLSSRRKFAAASILIASVSLIGCHDAAAPPSSTADPVAPVATAATMQLSNTLQVAGEFIPYQEVELHAKVAGYIRQMNADIGDHVHAGEVLATLDVPELNAQVQGANASVRQSGEQISRARSSILDAQANYNALHAASVRLQQASDARPGLIAQQELDNAAAKDQAANAQLDSAKSQLSAMQQQMQVSQAGQSQVSTMAAYSRIIAPFSGVVTWRYADPGALIQAGTSNAASAPVLKIAEVDKLRLRLPVPASVAPYVNDGDLATIRINELNRNIQGKVTRSTDALDPSTRTEQVEVDVPNADGSIKPGMYATVTMNVHHSANSITVPINAVDTSTDQPFVMLVDSSGHVQRHNVSVGISTADREEILSGVNAGDQVIVANLGSYKSGEKVIAKQSVLGNSTGEGAN